MCVGCDAHKVRNEANSQAMASQDEFGTFNVHLTTYNYSTIIIICPVHTYVIFTIYLSKLLAILSFYIVKKTENNSLSFSFYICSSVPNVLFVYILDKNKT